MSIDETSHHSHQQQLQIQQDNGILNNDILQAKSFVALCYSNKTIGIACYNELLNVIYTDSVPVSHTDISNILINLKIKLSPTLFIIHPSLISNKDMLDLILCSIDGTQNDYYKYTSLKTSCWSSETSLDYVCTKLNVKKMNQLQSSSLLPASSSVFTPMCQHNTSANVYSNVNHNSINSVHRQQSTLPSSSSTYPANSSSSSSSTTSTMSSCYPSQRNHQIHSNYLMLSAVIDLENAQLKSSLSALLTFMTNNLFNLDNGIVTVSSIKSLAIADYLKMDDLTYRYLNDISFISIIIISISILRTNSFAHCLCLNAY